MKSLSKIGIIASFTLIPINSVLTIGMLASYGSHNPSRWAWVFITFAFVLDIPAVLTSIFAPRTGACFLLFNALAALGIALFHLSTYGHSLSAELIHEPWFAFINGTLIWGPKAFFIWLLLSHSQRDTVDSIFADSQR